MPCRCVYACRMRSTGALQHTRPEPSLQDLQPYTPSTPEWLQGYTKAIRKKRGPKLPLDVICPLHNPLWGATIAGTTTKCQGKMLNNKSTSMQPMSLSLNHQELLAVLQLHFAQPAVSTTIVAPPAYKVLSDPSSNLV